MNEILVLERIADPDDGMFSCYTGTINGNGIRSLATFGDKRRAYRLIKAYLRKTGKSVNEYQSTEEVLKDFLEYCRNTEIELLNLSDQAHLDSIRQE